MCAIRGETLVAKAGDVMFIPKGSSIEFGTPSTVRFLYVAPAGKLAIAMNDFITEAWLRANHTLSEGGEIHLPADARLTPSARNCWKVGICGSNFSTAGGACLSRMTNRRRSRCMS